MFTSMIILNLDFGKFTVFKFVGDAPWQFDIGRLLLMRGNAE